MKLPWKQSEPTGVGATVASVDAQPCPTLAHALRALFRRKSKPEILNLGPLCGDTLVYLANRGARVAVEEFEPPLSMTTVDADDASSAESAVEADGEATEPEQRPRIDQPDERFDLILAWEQFDFVGDEHVETFTGELRRLLKPGGHLLLIAMNSSPTAPVTSGRLARYRVTDDDLVMREELPGAALSRWCRPTRDIERALAPLKVEKLHLHRNQMREFLAVRPLPKNS